MGPLETFNSGAFSGILLFLKILSIMLTLGFVGGALYVWKEHQETKELMKEKRHNHFVFNKDTKISPMKKRWQNASELFQAPDPNAWRIAILDADAMLEELITSMGFVGDTFGEKLKQMSDARVPWIDAAWEVHLLRNKLAHEGSRYPLTDREAYRAFKIYENIFFDTGFLA